MPAAFPPPPPPPPNQSHAGGQNASPATRPTPPVAPLAAFEKATMSSSVRKSSDVLASADSSLTKPSRYSNKHPRCLDCFEAAESCTTIMSSHPAAVRSPAEFEGEGTFSRSQRRRAYVQRQYFSPQPPKIEVEHVQSPLQPLRATHRGHHSNFNAHRSYGEPDASTFVSCEAS